MSYMPTNTDGMTTVETNAVKQMEAYLEDREYQRKRVAYETEALIQQLKE